jgi:dCMP deaminase
MPHCDYPHETKDCLAVHAEANAISWAARNGVRLDYSELHVTHEPCLQCARLILNAGVERVMFQEPYRLHEGYELLVSAGVDVLIIPHPVR